MKTLIEYREVNGVLVPANVDLKQRPEVTRAYLDESYDDVSYVVAGLLGAEEHWSGFDDDWDVILEKHDFKGVPLHMKELQKSNKEPWVSLRADAGKEGALLDDLVGVIQKHGLAAFGAMALMDEYNAMDAEMRKRWPMPYKLTFETACDALEDTCDPAPEGKGKIHVMVDQGPSQGWAKKAYEQLRAKSKERSQRFAEKLDAGDHRKTPGLCAADMISWELRRAVFNHLKHGKDTLRPSFQKLMNGLNMLWKVDFSQVIPTDKLVKFQGTTDPGAGAVGQIVLAVDEPLKM